MNKRKSELPTLKVMNIQAYIDANKDAKNMHYIIKPDGDYYLINGVMVLASLFEKPTQAIQLQKAAVDKGLRLDGRTNWME